MSYPISQPADNAAPYTYTQPIRDSIAGVNDHQNRINALETLASSTRTGNYNVVAGDVGVEQIYDSASAGTFTLPSNATSSVAIGKEIPLRQSNTGQLTVAAGSGATLVSRGSAFKLIGQHAVASVRKISTNGWLLYGDITT